MSSYGVTTEGFAIKPLDQIRTDIAARLRANIDAGLNLTASSPDGQNFLILTELISQMWELCQSTVATWDPDQAFGAWLDNLSAITGTVRRDAVASTVVVQVTTTQAVSVDAGAFVVSVKDNPSARFANVEPIVTSGASTDVSVHFAAQSTGPVVANAGTLIVIETPVVGIDSVANPHDAVVGADIESDSALRARREAELDAIGAGTLDSIRARLLRPVADGGAGCVDATIFENISDVTDSSGRPPHSVQAVVLGGKADDIAQSLWDVVGAGIQIYGSPAGAVNAEDTDNTKRTKGAATDSRGTKHDVSFDRAIERDVYIAIDVKVTTDQYPADGDEQIKQLLVARGEQL